MMIESNFSYWCADYGQSVRQAKRCDKGMRGLVKGKQTLTTGSLPAVEASISYRV